MKTINIAKFKVKDYPGLKKAINPINEEDLALMKSIWTRNIINCMERELHVDKDWIHLDHGFFNFVSFYAGYRKALRNLHNIPFSSRGGSIEQLQWRHTKGPKAGFYPHNLGYMVPMFTIDPKTGLYDLQERKGDDSKLLELLSPQKKGKKKSPKIKKVSRKVSFVYDFWEKKESTLVIPTIHNVPAHIACVHSERTGRKVPITKAIAEGGGLPYAGLLWLRKNPGATIEDAVEASIKELAEALKKKGLDYEEMVKSLCKTFKKVSENTIRAIIVDLFGEDGKNFSIEKVKTKLRRKNSNAHPCRVWNERSEYTDFASTDLAADALGCEVSTLHGAISRERKLGNKFWVTRGEVPGALKPKFDHRNDMEQLAQQMHIVLKDTMSPLEEKFVNLRMIEEDLSFIAQKLNLKEEILSVMWDELMDRLGKRLTLLVSLAKNTSLEMDSLSADSKERASKLAERRKLFKDGDGFIAYPNEGISEFTADSTGASNLNKKGSSKKDVKKP